MEKARCETHGWYRFSPFASPSFLHARFLHLRSASPSPLPFTPLPLSIPHSLYIKPYVMFGLRHHLYSAMPHALPSETDECDTFIPSLYFFSYYLPALSLFSKLSNLLFINSLILSNLIFSNSFMPVSRSLILTSFIVNHPTINPIDCFT